jgi:hypothetical protein
MVFATARARYLSAIGLVLASAPGCHEDRGNGYPSGWTLETGSFCIANPPIVDAATGAAPPYDQCPSVGEELVDPNQPTGPSHHGSFDPAGTQAERAKTQTACCYTWDNRLPGGRALRGHDGEARVAAATEGDDWIAVLDGIDGIDVDCLPSDVRAAVAAHWTREAAFEHASVASFARTAIDLMAHAAPPRLLAETHRAALDEIEHARIAYALASRYRGCAAIGPGPLTDVMRASLTLAELASATFEDACIGETIASLALREAASRAASPALRRILERLAADEERHAELAWRTVAWAVERGGRDVADAIRRSLARPAPTGEGTSDPRLEPHGVLSAAALAELSRAARTEVVLPCARALVSRRPSAGVS